MSASARRKIVEQYQTIEQLTARVRELEEEKRIAELIVELEHIREQKNLLWFEFSIATQQLAAEQLNNKLLREALEQIACGYEMGSAVSGVGENVIRLRFVSQEQMEKAFDSLTLLIDEAGNPSHNTSAIDTFVAEKVKEAGKFDVWKTNPYTKVLETSIKQLTKQRDLAVEALKSIVLVDGENPVLTYQGMEDIANKALTTIKESETK